jgi:hypothetical protein
MTPKHCFEMFSCVHFGSLLSADAESETPNAPAQSASMNMPRRNFETEA